MMKVNITSDLFPEKNNGTRVHLFKRF